VFCVRATEWHLTLGERDTKKITEQVDKSLILLQKGILKFRLQTIINSYFNGCKKYIYISCVLWLISFKMFARIWVKFTSSAVRKRANVLVLYSGLCNLCTFATETQNFKTTIKHFSDKRSCTVVAVRTSGR